MRTYGWTEGIVDEDVQKPQKSSIEKIIDLKNEYNLIVEILNTKIISLNQKLEKLAAYVSFQRVDQNLELVIFGPSEIFLQSYKKIKNEILDKIFASGFSPVSEATPEIETIISNKLKDLQSENKIFKEAISIMNDFYSPVEPTLKEFQIYLKRGLENTDNSSGTTQKRPDLFPKEDYKFSIEKIYLEGKFDSELENLLLKDLKPNLSKNSISYSIFNAKKELFSKFEFQEIYWTKQRKTDINSAFIDSYLISEQKPKAHAFGLVLGHIMSLEAFQYLRTEQKLGYVVHAGVESIHKNLIFFLLVQGVDRSKIRDQIEIFYWKIGEKLKSMEDINLEQTKSALIAQLSLRPTSLSKEAERSSKLQFEGLSIDYKQKVVDEIELVSSQMLFAFFEKVFKASPRVLFINKESEKNRGEVKAGKLFSVRKGVKEEVREI